MNWHCLRDTLKLYIELTVAKFYSIQSYMLPDYPITCLNSNGGCRLKLRSNLHRPLIYYPFHTHQEDVRWMIDRSSSLTTSGVQKRQTLNRIFIRIKTFYLKFPLRIF
jgi:hypothetical protein